MIAAALDAVTATCGLGQGSMKPPPTMPAPGLRHVQRVWEVGRAATSPQTLKPQTLNPTP